MRGDARLIIISTIVAGVSEYSDILDSGAFNNFLCISSLSALFRCSRRYSAIVIGLAEGILKTIDFPYTSDDFFPMISKKFYILLVYKFSYVFNCIQLLK